MPEVSYANLKKAIKSRKFAPVYFLHGEEAFFIDEISDLIASYALNESERDFNFNLLYGKDTSIDDIKSVANKYPMMADRQVVIVREAQDLKKLDQLSAYLQNPVSSTILVLCYKHKKLDKRTKFYKTLKDQAQVFQAGKVSEQKLPQWIEAYLHEQGYGIQPKASYLLTEYLGSDLKKVTNELDKLLLDDQVSKEVTIEDIEKNVGISKDYNIFELQNALGRKDVVTTTKIVNYYRANPKANPMPMLTASLFSYFSKLFSLVYKEEKATNEELARAVGIPNFVLNEHVKAAQHFKNKFDEVFEIIHEYDLRARGIDDAGTPEPELMREMLYRLLYL
jgi:DNA polymerase-3 subunit delta